MGLRQLFPLIPAFCLTLQPNAVYFNAFQPWRMFLFLSWLTSSPLVNMCLPLLSRQGAGLKMASICSP